MSVRSGFLLAKEKSPDRRVLSSRSPKGKYRKSGGRRDAIQTTEY